MCEGQIEVDGRLTIGTGGNANANIKAGEVVMAGSAKGNIETTGRLVLRAGASLEGDVKAAGIAIEDGAYFKGGVDIISSAIVLTLPFGGTESVPNIEYPLVNGGLTTCPVCALHDQVPDHPNQISNLCRSRAKSASASLLTACSSLLRLASLRGSAARSRCTSSWTTVSSRSFRISRNGRSYSLGSRTDMLAHFFSLSQCVAPSVLGFKSLRRAMTMEICQSFSFRRSCQTPSLS
jgi:hypothetical protein